MYQLIFVKSNEFFSTRIIANHTLPTHTDNRPDQRKILDFAMISKSFPD
jgi:hypothetical protein